MGYFELINVLGLLLIGFSKSNVLASQVGCLLGSLDLAGLLFSSDIFELLFQISYLLLQIVIPILHLVRRQRLPHGRLRSLQGCQRWHWWLPLLFHATQAQVAASIRNAELRLYSDAAFLSRRAHWLLLGLRYSVRLRHLFFRNNGSHGQVLNLLDALVHFLNLLVRFVR